MYYEILFWCIKKREERERERGEKRDGKWERQKEKSLYRVDKPVTFCTKIIFKIS